MSASLPMHRAVPASSDAAGWMMEFFVAGWLTLMPVNSFVVIPAIQGTTPAYLLAFVSLLLVFLPGYAAATAEVRRGYFRVIACLSLLWALNLCVSQIVNLASPPDYLPPANPTNLSHPRPPSLSSCF